MYWRSEHLDLPAVLQTCAEWSGNYPVVRFVRLFA